MKSEFTDPTSEIVQPQLSLSCISILKKIKDKNTPQIARYDRSGELIGNKKHHISFADRVTTAPLAIVHLVAPIEYPDANYSDKCSCSCLIY